MICRGVDGGGGPLLLLMEYDRTLMVSKFVYAISGLSWDSKSESASSVDRLSHSNNGASSEPVGG